MSSISFLNNQPLVITKFLQEHGDIGIVDMYVCRDPISSGITNLLNLVTANKFHEQMKNLNYDDLYHLYFLIKLSDDRVVRLEKNHRVTIGFSPAMSPNSFMRVALSGADLTMNKLMNHDIAYHYDAVTTNCQYFCMQILSYNKLLTPELETFVLQKHLKSLIGKWMEKAALIATNVGAVADYAIQGGGKKEKKEKKRRGKRPPTKWNIHVKALKQENPDIDFPSLIKLARSTYYDAPEE